MKVFTCFLFLTFLLVACEKPPAQNPEGVLSQTEIASTGDVRSTSDETSATAAFTLQGGDQGREGGHFVICSPISRIPDSRLITERKFSPNPEKVFFVDYFLTVRTETDVKKLFDFFGSQEDEYRLDMVTKRLLQIFENMPEMKRKAIRMIEYSNSFMGRKGRARWIENTNLPYEHELTVDFTPNHLGEEDLATVNQHCQARFYQAAIYDYSQPGDEIFYYSEFFEENASVMQKSFRNIHELLRYMMRNETQQVIHLTHYFHTKDFFFLSEEEVRQKIAEISLATKNQQAFYQE